ncbi:MAG: hypothetical protein KGD74_07265 [Candidatus Lokiarchaeota archaeon]|nr:hypothetical protein [Candidatus Lokiarchaeota archaeon]
MISEKEFKNYEEDFYFEESETVKKENRIMQIYEILELENIYDVFPNYDLQDEKLTQDILEIYKIIFWGLSALLSTLIWLYFFIN